MSDTPNDRIRRKQTPTCAVGCAILFVAWTLYQLYWWNEIVPAVQWRSRANAMERSLYHRTQELVQAEERASKAEAALRSKQARKVTTEASATHAWKPKADR